MTSVSALVDAFCLASPTDSEQEGLETLVQVGKGDPIICREISESIRKKLFSTSSSEQERALELLDRLMETLDLSFHQIVNEKEFLSALERTATRDASPATSKAKSLFSKWVVRFAGDHDILPNFALYHSRLVEQGLIEPVDTAPPVIDTFLLNEAEGQDPAEFMAEVKETIKLFDEVFEILKKGNEDLPRREALISLAANLDRYSEQFGLWIEQLDPGEYMDNAMTLNDKVTDALQRYKRLRSGALKKREESSSSSSDSDD
jgi:hypothetical protein